MSGLTQERWFVSEDERPGMEWNRHIMRDKNTAVCFMAHSAGRDPGADADRANLIAAAPRLAEALQRTLNYLSSYQGNGAASAYDQARAALLAAGVAS